MRIQCFAYKLRGDIWTFDHVPSAADVSYHVQMFNFFERGGYSGFPEHARAAAMDYCRTLRALLLSGF